MKTGNQALGVDIGGTKTALGVVTADGRVLAKQVFPTEPQQGFELGVRRICEAARQLAQTAGGSVSDLAGVGIGCTGPVNPRTGEINNPYTLPGWVHCNIVRAVGDALALPVWLENDADAAALGEYYFGAGQGMDPMVMLTVGTGVGGAVVTQGKIFRGVNGEHPELGHVHVAFDGSECYCGRRGCLEALISGPAIAAAGQPAGLVDASQVFAAAAAGHAVATGILANVRAAFDAAIWTVLHSFLPARIVLGGGLVEGQTEFFVATARVAVSRATMVPQQAVSVEPAQLGNLAGLVGAARWAMLRAAQSDEACSPP